MQGESLFYHHLVVFKYATMKPQTLNLFIVDDDPMVSMALSQHLTHRFGSELNITTFQSGKSALEKITSDTNMVILDLMLKGEDGNEILKSIKEISPRTEVVIFSSHFEMETAIRSFRNGATDYVLKGHKSGKKISSLVFHALTYPLRVMVQEFGINKYVAMFLLTFIAIGLGVFLTLKFTNQLTLAF